MRVAALVAVTAIAGCGGDSPICTERVDKAICWPELAHVPQGSAILGTGVHAFEPMPDVLKLEYGPQSGYDVVAHAQMSGFDPGNLQDILTPGNPRTRIRAYFADSNVPLNRFVVCPFRTAYTRAKSGHHDYELPGGVGIIFDVCWRSDRLIGKQVRLELEVMDDCGGYTTDVKTVTLGPPEGDYPIETNTPGCPPVAEP